MFYMFINILTTLIVHCIMSGILLLACSEGLFAEESQTSTAIQIAASNGHTDASLLAEISFWESIKDSQNADEFLAYITEYPEGRFVSLARLRIKALADANDNTDDRGSGLSGSPAAQKPSVMGEILPYKAAVEKAVNKVFSNIPKKSSSITGDVYVLDPDVDDFLIADIFNPRVDHNVVFDPLIDGVSGAQSSATRTLQSDIAELLKARYAQLKRRDFTPGNVAESPYVIIGTFTGVNKQRKTSGVREFYRICLALIDIETGRVISKAKVFSQGSGIDITPSSFFRDSPVWMADPSIQAYIKSCQATKPGDSIDPLYVEHVKVASILNQAVTAYEKGQYRASQKLFQRAYPLKGGKQLRTYNGLYLTSKKLAEHKQAMEAFDELINYGLQSGSFAVNFPFKTNSIDLQMDVNNVDEYDQWLEHISHEALRHEVCLEISGHTRRLGSKASNLRLSVSRAEEIKRRMEKQAPELSSRLTVTGQGSQENIIGSGTGDARDALDRRVEFNTVQCL